MDPEFEVDPDFAKLWAKIELCASHLRWIVYRVWVNTFDVFLRGLYFNGPSLPLLRMGFWGGANHDDACASMTNTPSSWWRTDGEPSLQCLALREKEYVSFLYGLGAVLIALFVVSWVMFVMISCAFCICWRCTARSMARKIVTEMRPALPSVT